MSLKVFEMLHVSELGILPMSSNDQLCSDFFLFWANARVKPRENYCLALFRTLEDFVCYYKQRIAITWEK